MAVRATFPRWTVEEYFAMEGTSTVRHEYIDGAVYALAGGTQAHGVLAATLGALLWGALRGGPCRVYSSDGRVQLTPTRYTYPDLSVGCGPAGRDDAALFLAAPRLVAEILSESTAAYDRGDKFDDYQRIASLRDYVLVETAQRLGDVRSRGEDGVWATRQYGSGELVRLPSLGISVAVDALYADVDEIEAD